LGVFRVLVEPMERSFIGQYWD